MDYSVLEIPANLWNLSFKTLSRLALSALRLGIVIEGLLIASLSDLGFEAFTSPTAP